MKVTFDKLKMAWNVNEQIGVSGSKGPSWLDMLANFHPAHTYYSVKTHEDEELIGRVLYSPASSLSSGGFRSAVVPERKEKTGYVLLRQWKVMREGLSGGQQVGS